VEHARSPGSRTAASYDRDRRPAQTDRYILGFMFTSCTTYLYKYSLRCMTGQLSFNNTIHQNKMKSSAVRKNEQRTIFSQL